MSISPAEAVQALLGNPRDLAHVKSLTTADVTYVSLSEHNPALKALLPWAGINRGPESIVRIFESIANVLELQAFELRDVIEQGDRAALFGRFTYRARETGREIASLFSLLVKLESGKIDHIQFLEDSFGMSCAVRRES